MCTYSAAVHVLITVLGTAYDSTYTTADTTHITDNVDDSRNIAPRGRWASQRGWSRAKTVGTYLELEVARAEACQ